MSETAAPLTKEDVEARLLRGPFHQWLGLKVVALGDGEIEIRSDLAPGMELSILNEDMSMAAFSRRSLISQPIGPWCRRPVVAFRQVDLRVDYHRAAMQGDLLSAAARS